MKEVRIQHVYQSTTQKERDKIIKEIMKILLKAYDK